MEAITVGERLGSYHIEALFGTGGTGVVYLAKDLRLRRRVAIKVLDPSCGVADGHQALLREARVWAALTHPSICRVHKVGQFRGEPFIVMEHVAGISLATAIPPDLGLPAKVALSYGFQIADAAAHAHRRGVVHGDLKTANIMVGDDDRVKILDFGLAARYPVESDTTRDETTR